MELLPAAFGKNSFNTKSVLKMNAHLSFSEKKDVLPATLEDLPLIYWLFEKAIAYQKENGFVGWQTYDKNYLKADVEKGLLFKLIHEKELVCIFCICYSDPVIWRKKEQGDAIYLHRVVVHPEHRGEHLFAKVFEWAIDHARLLQRRFIRMDTWADNQKIIQYYSGYGFRFVEEYKTPNDPNLPDQHRNLKVALLEYSI